MFQEILMSSDEFNNNLFMENIDFEFGGAADFLNDMTGTTLADSSVDSLSAASQYTPDVQINEWDNLEPNFLDQVDITPLAWLNNNRVVNFGPPLHAPANVLEAEVINTPSPSETISEGNNSHNGENLENSPSKPGFSFTAMIASAITSHPEQEATVRYVYEYIKHHFPYYRNAKGNWKNSVRHNLSLNKCFTKSHRAAKCGDGKGALWTIKPSARATVLAEAQRVLESGLLNRVPAMVTLAVRGETMPQRLPLRSHASDVTIASN
eukprot:Clim_evm1s207 gene=Clim_evmTU1s207